VKPPKERGFRRVISVDLDDPQYDPVFAYALETGPDRPVQDAIRDLLLQALAVNAADTSIRNARRLAYLDARNRAASAIFAFMKGLAREFEAEAAGSEVHDSIGNTISTDALPDKAA
jgi:hypothetical protein